MSDLFFDASSLTISESLGVEEKADTAQAKGRNGSPSEPAAQTRVDGGGLVPGFQQ